MTGKYHFGITSSLGYVLIEMYDILYADTSMIAKSHCETILYFNNKGIEGSFWKISGIDEL